MIKIIGVKFRKPGKVYYFDPTGFTVQKGDHVIVETARGVEYGTVVLGPKEVTDDQVVQPLKPLMRVATEEDAAVCASNEEKEKDAFQICLEKIKKHGLEMKLIDSEYTFDRNKLLFYFTADGRIDFRELVKDLASVFHRLAFLKKRKCLAVLPYVVDLFAVTLICPTLCRFLSRWQKSKTYPSTRLRSPAYADV